MFTTRTLDKCCALRADAIISCIIALINLPDANQTADDSTCHSEVEIIKDFRSILLPVPTDLLSANSLQISVTLSLRYIRSYAVYTGAALACTWIDCRQLFRFDNHYHSRHV